MSDLSLGQFLRQERESKGITLEQVASGTKISIRLLHLLEADHYKELPAIPFVRGFVASYSRFIGLDANEVLTRYGDYIRVRGRERPTREEGHSGYAFEQKDTEQSRSILWLVMAGFVVLGGLVIFILKPTLRQKRNRNVEKLKKAQVVKKTKKVSQPSVPSGDSNQAAAVQTDEKGKKDQVKAPAPSTPEKKDVAAKEEPKVEKKSEVEEKAEVEKASKPEGEYGAGENPADPLDSGKDLQPQDVTYKGIFTALADVWIRYQVDQRPVRQFLLRKGKVLVLRGREGVLIQTSNDKSLSYRYNYRNYKVTRFSEDSVERQGNPTLIFPLSKKESVEEPFPGEKTLPSTADPVEEDVESDENSTE